MGDKRPAKIPVIGEKRSKLRHDRSSSRRTEPVVQEGSDMSFGYLFDNDMAAHRRFVKSFMSRRIYKLKSLDLAFFTSGGGGFEIMTVLRETHLQQFAEMKCQVMVRAFYQNLHYTQGELTSRVCGIDIVMTAADWTELLGYDFDADADAVHYDGDSQHVFEGFDREVVIEETRRADAEPGQFVSYPVSNLSVSARILHYVATHILFQRPSNHSKVLEGDFVILWALLHRIKVNWRNYICILMHKAAKSERKAEFPYAYLVQKILERWGVPMHTETLKSHTHWNAVFGERLLKQCGIMQRPDGVWQWKTAPMPPEIPLQHDDQMDDVTASDEPVDDDAADGADAEHAAGPAVGHHPRFRPPPPPVRPEDGWTLDDVMISMHFLTCSVTHQSQSTSRMERRMGTLERRMSSLEAAVRRRGHLEDPPAVESSDEEEEGDDDDDEDDEEDDE